MLCAYKKGALNNPSLWYIIVSHPTQIKLVQSVYGTTNLSSWVPLHCFLPQLLEDFWCHGHTNTFKDVFNPVRGTRLEKVFLVNTSVGVDRWVHQTIGIRLITIILRRERYIYKCVKS